MSTKNPERICHMYIQRFEVHVTVGCTSTYFSLSLRWRFPVEWGTLVMQCPKPAPGYAVACLHLYGPATDQTLVSYRKKRIQSGHRFFPFPLNARSTAAAPRPARTGTGDNGVNVVRVGTGVCCVAGGVVVVCPVCVTVIAKVATGVGVALVGVIPPRYQGACVGVGV